VDALLINAGWLVALLLVVVGSLASLGATMLVRRGVSGIREGHNAVLGTLLGTGSIFTGIVIALAVFVVWNHLTVVQQAEADQGATLIVLYHDAEVLPEPGRTQVESAIRDYTTSMIVDEFPALATGRGSDRTERSLSRLNAVVHQYLDGTGAPDQVSAIARSQYRLVEASSSGMPPLMWAFLIGVCVLLLLMAAPLFMESARIQWLGSILLGCSLGAALFLIIIADHPYAGPFRVTPTDLTANLHTYGVIDATAEPAQAAR
jgi:hypothetical protein